jgi:hypothetical protein
VVAQLFDWLFSVHESRCDEFRFDPADKKLTEIAYLFKSSTFILGLSDCLKLSVRKSYRDSSTILLVVSLTLSNLSEMAIYPVIFSVHPSPLQLQDDNILQLVPCISPPHSFDSTSSPL